MAGVGMKNGGYTTREYTHAQEDTDACASVRKVCTNAHISEMSTKNMFHAVLHTYTTHITAHFADRTPQ